MSHKLGQSDLDFRVQSGFISKSVQERLQMSVCSAYDCSPVFEPK